MSEEFEVFISEGKGVIKVTQNLVSEAPAEHLENAFSVLEERGQTRIVIDLSGTEAINSFGLGKIFTLLDRVKENGGELSIRIKKNFLSDIIKTLLIDKILTVEEVA